MYIVFFGNMIAPVLQNTRDNTLFKGKAILLFGARKVGKTTLLTQWANSCHKPILEVSGEEPDIRELLSSITSTQLKNYIGHNTLFIIDEAQRLANTGLALKLITDKLKHVHTGPSAFDRANKMNEPFGRKFEYKLFPVTQTIHENHE